MARSFGSHANQRSHYQFSVVTNVCCPREKVRMNSSSLLATTMAKFCVPQQDEHPIGPSVRPVDEPVDHRSCITHPGAAASLTQLETPLMLTVERLTKGFLAPGEHPSGEQFTRRIVDRPQIPPMLRRSALLVPLFYSSLLTRRTFRSHASVLVCGLPLHFSPPTGTCSVLSVRPCNGLFLTPSSEGSYGACESHPLRLWALSAAAHS